MGNCCEYILAVLLPPVAVGVKTGCSCELFLNIVLCCLLWLPGIIHACVVVSRDPPVVVYQVQGTAPVPPPGPQRV